MSGVARGVASVADRPIRLGPTTTPGRRRIPRSRRRQRRGAHTQRQRFAAPRSCRPPWSRTTAGPRSRSAGRSKAVRTFRHGVENGGSIVRERARRRVRYSISGGLGEPVPPGKFHGGVRATPQRLVRRGIALESPEMVHRAVHRLIVSVGMAEGRTDLHVAMRADQIGARGFLSQKRRQLSGKRLGDLECAPIVDLGEVAIARPLAILVTSIRRRGGDT